MFLHIVQAAAFQEFLVSVKQNLLCVLHLYIDESQEALLAVAAFKRQLYEVDRNRCNVASMEGTLFRETVLGDTAAAAHNAKFLRWHGPIER